MNPAFHEGGEFLGMLTPTPSDLPAGSPPQSLSWYQLVGVSAIVGRIFMSEVGPGSQGILLADEVGWEGRCKPSPPLLS